MVDGMEITARRNLMSKDLGEGLENLESEIESLKTKDFRLFGVKMNAVSISAALTLSASLIGSLYGGFIFYKDYMDMREIVENIDVGAIESRNKVIETKLDEAIDYTRDIKTGLKEDILSVEKQVDRIEDKLRDQEREVREIVQNAEERFENKRDALQNDYDQKASRLRDTTDQKIEDVENRLNQKLQRALDNPLAN
jgi:Skp family chaperone for outer membrane proteins